MTNSLDWLETNANLACQSRSVNTFVNKPWQTECLDMALYKDGNKLAHSDHVAFDTVLTPGTIAANSGIYRCTGCGDEDACNKGNPLPSQNHRQHNQQQGAIRWQLLVCAIQQQ